jgi:putative ABC transport system permease protein
VALLLGLRLAARRPRRMVLSAVSIAITVSTIVTVLTAQAWLDAHQLHTSSGLEDPQDTRLRQVMLIITVVLVILAAINITFITWSTVIDSRRQLAVTRALGATPGQVSAALSTAQLLPAVVGVILGIPGGIGLYAAVSNNSGSTVTPPVSWLIAVVLGSLIVVGGLTAIPARIAARRPVAPVLQSELA